jgi:hypothetical protein
MKLQNKVLIDFKGQPLKVSPPQGQEPTGDEPNIYLADILLTVVTKAPVGKAYSEDENRLRWNVGRQLAQVEMCVPFEFPDELVETARRDVAVMYNPMVAGQVLEDLSV